MNTGTMQMTALQHQQMRTQQQTVVAPGQQNLGQPMAQSQVMGQGQMTQMNSINQQMMHLQQLQNVMQQNNSQVILQ